MANIDTVFGEGFESKLKAESLKKNFSTLTGENKYKVLDFIVDNIKANKTKLTFSIGSKVFDILLVQASADLKTTELGWGIRMNFRNVELQFVQLVVPVKDSSKIIPEEHYVAVGYLKQDPYQGRTYWKMNTVNALFTMDEIVEYKRGKEESKEETLEALNEHKKEEEE